jgi:DNA-binding beta-propeller fold protein YncE
VLAAVLLLGAKCSLFNKAPTVPAVTGPAAGVAGVPVTFRATATDPDGDSIAFQFDWGDATTPAWSSFLASGETLTASHTYADSGTYTVKAKAKDAGGKESEWSGGLGLALLVEGPDVLDTIIGAINMPFNYNKMVIAPAGDYGYALLGESAGLQPVNLATRTPEAMIRLPAVAWAAAVAPDGAHVYLVSRSGRCVISVRTADRAVDATAQCTDLPYGIATSFDGQLLLVTGAIPDAVMVLRAADLAPVDTILGAAVRTTAGRSDGTFFGYTFASILRFDLGAGAAVDSAGGMNPVGLLVTSDWRKLYAFEQTDSNYVVLDVDNLSSRQYVNAHTYGVGGMGISPDDRFFYYTDGYALRIVDTRNQVVVHSIPYRTKAPFAVHPSGDSLYLFGNLRRVDIVGRKP